jgi:hypothetical protein
MADQLTFLLAEPHANHSQSQDLEKDWTTRVVTSCSHILPLLNDMLPSGSSGKTSPVCCPATEDGTLEPSSGRWGNSGMGSLTECWTLSISEWPSDASVCSLSDTLETGDVPQRFYLSAIACRGILRRAEKRGKIAPTVTTGAPFSRTGNESVECEAIVPVGYTSSSFGGYHQGVGTIRAAGGDLGGGSETLCVSQPIAFSSKQQSMKTSDNVANTLGANDYKEPQAVAIQNATRGASQNGLGITTDGPMYTLDVGSQHAVAIGYGVITPSQVRRLTPIECERLQGFPDNYTDIRLNDKQTPDGPRYKAMGNSMAVPVMNWIGRRIQMVEDTE